MPAKKHHYVPVFYQKGFADADGLLWVYDRKLQTYKKLHPIVLCRAEDLYAVRPENAPRDRTIETDVLSPIEGVAAPIVRKLSPGVALDRREVRALVMFIGLQFTRLPSFGRAVSRTLETTMDEWLRMQFGTLKRAESALKELESQNGESDISAEAMVDAVVNKKVKAKANETAFLRHMFEQANTLGLWLEDSQWTFLVAPHSSGFIVCDHPFVSVPAEGTVLDGMSYGVPGATSYFPITQALCLRVRHGDYGFSYQNVDSRTVRTVNHNIAANSDRFIMGSNRRQLEAIVEKSGCVNPEPGERFSIDFLKTDENESLLKFTIRPRRYFYVK
jgi:hypothetical protein